MFPDNPFFDTWMDSNNIFIEPSTWKMSVNEDSVFFKVWVMFILVVMGLQQERSVVSWPGDMGSNPANCRFETKWYEVGPFVRD